MIPPPRMRLDPASLPPAPTLDFERAAWAAGHTLVAGMDEAGRGALAGPVAVGAVILPAEPDIAGILSGVRDSKQMTSAQREYWAASIRQQALAWTVGLASAFEVDVLGILPATLLAARRALEALSPSPQHLLLDYLTLSGCQLPQTSLIKGDRRSLSIAAASVLAKTARDDIMRQEDGRFPVYGFAIHKGYGTAAHLQALQANGPSPIHRRTFAPLRFQSDTPRISQGEHTL